MKIKSFVGVTEEFPEAKVILELSNGKRFYASGFWVKKDSDNKVIIVIKASKKLSI